MDRPFAAYTGDEPYVFVSYAHEDSAFVLAEIKWLQNQGFNVWYDEGIAPGHAWREEIGQKIQDASCILFVVTEHSIAAEHCIDEVEVARAHNINILSVHPKAVELSPGLELAIGRYQAILKYEFSDDLYREKLKDVLAEFRIREPAPTAVPKKSRKHVIVALAVMVVTVLVASLYPYWMDYQGQAEIDSVVVPKIKDLIEAEDFSGASVLLSEYRDRFDEETLTQLQDQVYVSVTIPVEPGDIRISVRPYNNITDWRELVLENGTALVPRGVVKFRFSKDGYSSLTRLLPTDLVSRLGQLGPGGGSIRLQPGADPESESWVAPAAILLPPNYGVLPSITVPDFFIDKYEVSNREFKEFIDAGGYDTEEFWTDHAFETNGQEISWRDAISTFVDTTGRPGPSTWELGNFPQGKDNHPVSGVSWYEAVAYARFRGRELPTIFHWSHAAGVRFEALYPPVFAAANFSATDTRPVSDTSMNANGIYDGLGNVREWVWNSLAENPKRRPILGGAYNDPGYFGSQRYDLYAYDRSEGNGFRTVAYRQRDEIPQSAFEPIQFQNRDYTTEQPKSADVVDSLIRQFIYAPTDLNIEVVQTSTDGDALVERVSIDTGYNNERIILHIFKPREGDSHPVVIYFPGINRFQVPGDSMTIGLNNGLMQLDFIVRSGRTLVWPVYKGSFERFDDNLQALSGVDFLAKRRNRTLRWRQDLGRTIDYLETRDDVDTDRIAYIGFSHGASRALPLLALETRLKVAVLWSGGMPYRVQPDVSDPINYLSRVHIPVLMIGGTLDGRFPVETYQRELYERLGTELSKKRWVKLNAGHFPLPRTATVRETIDWLDQYQ